MWLRTCSIVAEGAGGSMDVSSLRCRVTIKQHGRHGPDKAVIRITNQKPSTAKMFTTPGAEFSKISIYAGYQDASSGLLFKGDIIQGFYGRENPTDTLTTIVTTSAHAANGYATNSKAFAPGATPKDHVDAAVAAMSKYGIKLGFIGPSVNLNIPKYPYATHLFGMAKQVLYDVARSKRVDFTIKNDEVRLIGPQDVLPGGTVVLNAHTGMIGMPTQQIGGIMVRSLINPAIQVQGLIQINEGDIQRMELPTDRTGHNDTFQGMVDLAGISADGIYKVYQIDVEGDTRGAPWYMDIQALQLSQWNGGTAASRDASQNSN